MNRFFVDAETDGLYGGFLSIAALVTDAENREADRFYGAVSVRPDAVQSQWVREHVLPHLHRAEQAFDSEDALLEAFWAFWVKHRDGCQCIADVAFPVEARLFARCVRRNVAEREFLAPFPLLDLSAVLLSRGVDPLADRTALSGLPLVPHDALHDVRMAAKIWSDCFAERADDTEE